MARLRDTRNLERSYGLRIHKEGRMVFYRLAKNWPEPLLEDCLHQLVALSRAGRGMRAREA